MSKKSENAVVALAKAQDGRDLTKPVYLSTGHLVKLTPVSASLINDAQMSIPDPEIPMWYDESRKESYPNPDHPDYLAAVKTVDTQRSLAALDCMIMFGVTLVDDEGNPIEVEPGDWLKKLQFMSKRNLIKIDFGQFDLKDPLDIEFLFKKYIAVASPDIVTVAKVSGMTEEDVAAAQESFRGN